jgi:hypothetical protein
MYLDKINFLFIHNEKSAGNYITKNFIKYNLTSEKIVKKDHDDGINEFTILGEYSAHKHHNVNEYLKRLNIKRNDIKIVTNIRDPLDRLISFYFASGHNMKTKKIIKKINHQMFKFFKTNLPFSPKLYDYVQPEFTKEKFISFINSVDSQKKKFLLDEKYIYPDEIIYFKNLNNDLKNFLKRYSSSFKTHETDKQLMSNKLNQNKKEKFDKNLVYKDKEIINEFKKSSHFSDYTFFKIPLNENI